MRRRHQHQDLERKAIAMGRPEDEASAREEDDHNIQMQPLVPSKNSPRKPNKKTKSSSISGVGVTLCLIVGGLVVYALVQVGGIGRSSEKMLCRFFSSGGGEVTLLFWG